MDPTTRPEPRGAERALAAAAAGPLGPVFVDPLATDVLVDPSAVWVDRGGGLRRERIVPLGERRVRALAARLIALGGRHVDDASPIADVRLADGVRVHVVLAPVAVGGTSISVRLPAVAAPTLAGLRRSGGLTAAQSARLVGALVARRGVLVTGATGAGKTTLLAALHAEAPPEERIVIVEDVAELAVEHPQVVRLEARQPNVDGAGGIRLGRLVREAMRMRPDRLLVGECRDADVVDVLVALTAGHAGGSTLHAGGLAEVPARLESLGALAGIDAAGLARLVSSAVGLVVHVERSGSARRVAGTGVPRVSAAGALTIDADPA